MLQQFVFGISSVNLRCCSIYVLMFHRAQSQPVNMVIFICECCMEHVFDVTAEIFRTEYDVYTELFFHIFNVAILYFWCFKCFVLVLQRTIQCFGRPGASSAVLIFESRRDGRWGYGSCGFSRAYTLVRGLGRRVNMGPQRNSSWAAYFTNCNFAGRVSGFV